MDDVIARYRRASESGDVAGLMELLHPQAELVSPISANFVFRGPEDLRILLGAVLETIRDLRWAEQVSDGRVALLRGSGRVGPLRLDDAMVFELEDERIRRIRPHFRPWLGLTAFALVLGAKMARHPGVMMRALRAA